MSWASQVAVLPAAGRHSAGHRARATAERPVLRLFAFAALGLYGVIRWATLLEPAPWWRLLGLLAVSVALGAAGALLGTRRRALAIAATLVAILGALALAGVPVAWITHVRIAVTARAIGEGLSVLPRMLVPYNGINDWVRVVIVLGAGILLLDAGVLLAFAPQAFGDLRRAGAALPLVALAVVPSTLVRPQWSYLQGLILFALIAVFIWGERVPRDDLAVLLAVCAGAGAVGIALAPAIDRHTPWINYQALAGNFGPGHVESFDWTQRYGPINWPRTGRVMLEVQAPRGDYWKAENLDVFDGRGWTEGAGSENYFPAPDRAALSRWTQTIQVTLRTMRTTDVIAAGEAAPPQHLFGQVLQGQSFGTWSSANPLGPGDSYRVSVYAPHPTAYQLAHAGNGYPQTLPDYRSIKIAQMGGSQLPIEVVFAPFHSGGAANTGGDVIGDSGVAIVESSPYANAYALARRLAGRATTPYDFVASVERFLSTSNGFAYDETPPLSTYPLESFLFGQRLGYCQHFAGAMALLLRMGGIPARVAVGFTSGTYNPTTHRWTVTDFDAHAWVEAWFPHYGWVRFDPTPAADPALGGRAPIGSFKNAPDAGAASKLPLGRRDVRAGNVSTDHAGGGGGFDVLGLALIVAGALALAAVLVVAVRGRGASTVEEMLSELERAFDRTGRPLAPGVTLAALERRFGGSDEAAAYIQALRLARFSPTAPPPTLSQRRALRAQLRAGLGFTGRARALWALPPRWQQPHAEHASSPSPAGIH